MNWTPNAWPCFRSVNVIVDERELDSQTIDLATELPPGSVARVLSGIAVILGSGMLHHLRNGLSICGGIFLITITRRHARGLHRVFRLADTGSRRRAAAYPVILQADETGLVIRLATADVRIACARAGSFNQETMAIPLQILSECAGNNFDSVTLATDAKGQVFVNWLDHQVPQGVAVDAHLPASDAVEFSPAETFASNPPCLWQAFCDAAATADNTSTRYSLGCIELRGSRGSLAATDGRQLLMQSGFDFPWDEDILIPASKVFSSREINCGQLVRVGRSTDWFTLKSDPWTISLRIVKEGRFPKVDDLLRPVDAATTTLSVERTDAKFLADALPRLPSHDATYQPVTLDLNGHVCLRGRPEHQDRPTELWLTNSRWQGQPSTLNTDRRFFARALQLGFREVSFYGPLSPAICREGNRQYLWSLLEPGDAIKPSRNALRSESPPRPNQLKVRCRERRQVSRHAGRLN